jgi:small subunit ribosomal protein S2
MPYVNQRWLGGMLTNFSTVSGRVKRMQELRAMQAAGDFDAMPKKEALRHVRELEKLSRNLGGIATLDRLPEAIFVIDTKKEHIAVTEANKLGLPVVAVVDTNCDPDVINFVIPGNDDAIRSGALMCRVIADAVVEGRFVAHNRPAPKPAANGSEAPSGTPRSAPSRRPAARAKADAAPESVKEETPQAEETGSSAEPVAVADAPAPEPTAESAPATEAVETGHQADTNGAEGEGESSSIETAVEA